MGKEPALPQDKYAKAEEVELSLELSRWESGKERNERIP
jgi:hypothetical protein